MKILNFLPLVIVSVFCHVLSVYACVNPIDRYSSGVLFNNGEKFCIDFFNHIGKPGENFILNCTTAQLNSPVKKIQLLNPDMNPRDLTDRVSVKRVELFNSYIFIDIDYEGGSSEHQFFLSTDSVLEKPDTVSFTLLHNANNDICKDIISERLIFDLDAFERHFFSSAPLFIMLNGKPVLRWYPDNMCTVKYRSHYDSDAMVHLSFTRDEDEGVHIFPSMRIVTDTIFSDNGFDYGIAVVTELNWLISNGIIDNISEATLFKIEKSMEKKQGLYWTLQDSLIDFNAFFTYNQDSLTGELSWGKFSYSNRNNCGSDIKYELPPSLLNGNITQVKNGIKISMKNEFSVLQLNSSILINFKKNTSSKSYVDIVDLTGKLLKREIIPVNNKNFKINNTEISRGMYQVLVRTENWTGARNLIVW